MSTFIANVSNTMVDVPLPSGIVSVDLTYENNSGDAGNIMIVPDAISSDDATARMIKNDLHMEILPGETRSLKFNPITRPSRLYVKSLASLSSGSNKLHIRENSEMLIPQSAPNLSTKLKAYYPCSQSVDLYMRDGKGSNNIPFGAALTVANAWGTPGGLTLPALSSSSTLYYPILPAATWNSWFSYANGDSFLIHLRTDVTPGAGNLSLIASGYSATGSNNGFKIRVTNTGTVTFAAYALNGNIVNSINPVNIISSGEHSVSVFLDGQSKVVTIYIDGEVDSLQSPMDTVDSFQTTRGLYIGGEPASSGTTQSGPAGIYRDIQFYTWVASAPSLSHVSSAVARLHATIGPLLSSEL